MRAPCDRPSSPRSAQSQFEIIDDNTYWLWGNRCPSGRSCRWSDVAAYKLYNPGKFASAAGTLARTLGPPTNLTSNSLQIDAASPTFTFAPYVYCGAGNCNSDDYIQLFQGDTAHKIGSASGWTHGVVTRTCSDEAMFELGVDLFKTLICQTDVASRSVGGDSGSPVFAILNGQAHAAGIVWGGDGSEYAYSPIASMLEMGDIGRIRYLPPTP